MLTAKQRELLMFIDQRLGQTGISPSFDEMREALDLKSKSGVHRLISALEERGFIRRLPNRARALEVMKLPELRPNATVTQLRFGPSLWGRVNTSPPEVSRPRSTKRFRPTFS